MKGTRIAVIALLSVAFMMAACFSSFAEEASKPPVPLSFDEQLFSYQKSLPKEPPAPFDFSGGKVFKQKVWGKEWRIEKVESGFKCTWGDETVNWEPKPWHPDYYKEQGPAFWSRWSNLEHLPWVPLEEREKWKGAEWWHVSSDGQQMTGYTLDRIGTGIGVTVSPGGKERVKYMTEGWRSYFLDEAKTFLPEEERNVVMRKYITVQLYPDDVRGLSVRSTSYFPYLNKPDDNWLYIPSVRKVRRQSEGNRQDYLPGTLNRVEDYVLTYPIHNYKVVRTELLQDPGAKRYGFGDSYAETENPRYDSIGVPCVVIEVTPYKKKWWFHKLYRYINILGCCGTFEDAYNEKGELIRDMNCGNIVRLPEEYPYHLMYSDWGVYEYDTGYKSLLINAPWSDSKYAKYGDMEEHYDTGMPETIWSDETMCREVSDLLYWR